MTDKIVERLAKSDFSNEWLLGHRNRKHEQIERYQKFIQDFEGALAIRTGHGLTGLTGVTCLCGWYSQGGYPSDKHRALRKHVEEEWSRAAQSESVGGENGQ